MGGWTAADLATRHPDRVERLALLCPAGIGRQTIAKVGRDRDQIFSDDALRRLTMPVLAVLGERDRVFEPVQTRRRLEALLPDVRVDGLPGWGHALLGQFLR